MPQHNADVTRQDKEPSLRPSAESEEAWTSVSAAYDFRDEAVLAYLPFTREDEAVAK